MSGRYPAPKPRRDVMSDLFHVAAVTGFPEYHEGGCDECAAVQRVRMLEPLVWRTTVLHDDWCSRWARIRAKEDRA